MTTHLFIYQNLGLRRGHSFTRGVEMGPYSVAHPQYLLSPEYPCNHAYIQYYQQIYQFIT